VLILLYTSAISSPLQMTVMYCVKQVLVDTLESACPARRRLMKVVVRLGFLRTTTPMFHKLNMFCSRVVEIGKPRACTVIIRFFTVPKGRQTLVGSCCWALVFMCLLVHHCTCGSSMGR